MNASPGSDLSDVLAQPRDSHRYRLVHNKWFSQLRDKGYSISVYQNTWLDLCNHADACFHFGGSLASLMHTSLTTVQRIEAILREFTDPHSPGISPLAALETLDRLMEDLEQRPKGTAYIAHLAIPHAGYLFRDDCSISDPDQWDGYGRRTPVLNTPDQRMARYNLYLSQLTCASNLMEELFDTLKRIGAYDEATIIVHGDHGSRIGKHRWFLVAADDLSERDLIDLYSTHLAVKSPRTSPGLRTTPVSIQDYFARDLMGIEPNSDDRHRVFMRQPHGLEPREFRWRGN
jgi:hypothetical protein